MVGPERADLLNVAHRLETPQIIQFGSAHSCAGNGYHDPNQVQVGMLGHQPNSWPNAYTSQL